MWLSFQFRPGKTMVWIKERNSWYNVMRRMRGKGDLVKVGTNFPLVFQSLLDICRGMAACPTAGRLMVEAKGEGWSTSAAFILCAGSLGLNFPAGKQEKVKQFLQIPLEQRPGSRWTVHEVHAGLWTKSINTHGPRTTD